MDKREYLANLVYAAQEVDDWLAGRSYSISTYDSELGYIHSGGRRKDGMDGSICTYSYDENGARSQLTFAAEPCRINTYGDSFTHCDQVNGGETWQERLAAHLGEPIRNFGIGGYSVYQAYLRMRQEEARVPSEYIIFNIWDDDHFRSLSGWQTINFGKKQRRVLPTLPYVEVNLEAGEIVERGNICPTPESLYGLCDPDWVFDHFNDQFTLDMKLEYLESAHHPAASFFSFGTEHPLHRDTALFASMRLVEKVEEFAATHNRSVLFVLSYSDTTISRAFRDGHRFDQRFVEFMQEGHRPYVDLLEAHRADFAQFNLSVEEYLKRFYINTSEYRGHYNPAGNLFQAFAIKHKLVELLEPKPVSYRDTA